MCSRCIGVLAVQGAFAEHAARLRQMGCEVLELRQRADTLRPFDGLVLPGGESTAQAKLLDDLRMKEPLRQAIREGMPTLGTCAGLILLAETVENTGDGRDAGEGAASAASAVAVEAAASAGYATPVEGFRTLPVVVRRNGYGRQLGSFAAMAPLSFGGTVRQIPLTFIRAPRILSMGPGVETLVALDGEPVTVRFGNQIGCCFHPELDASDALYDVFLDYVRGRG